MNSDIYRETGPINLKREFPRIPFYPDLNNGPTGAHA